MLLSLNWLQEFIDHGLSTDELADRLTMSGTEVKAIHRIGGEFDGVVVAEVIALDPHPQADRLRLPTLRFGSDRTQQVVCGAANLAVGQKIAFAAVGATLFMDPAQKERQVLTAATIRGVESAGMVCSERELGLGTSHKGILVLDPACEIGMPLADALDLRDTIFELEITPNRGDCLSVLGVAREVAALTQRTITIPDASAPSRGIKYADLGSFVTDRIKHLEEKKSGFAITVDVSDLCPRFSAVLLKGITTGTSPIIMRWRLINCGVRPISNIVDVTNYVMLEFGAPQHAYDRRDISGSSLAIRAAHQGERMKTLDGAERILSDSMVVVADETKVLGLAGIMGAENSEIKHDTTDIVLESAHWDPVNIRHTTSQLEHHTEAAARFEKFVDPDLTMVSLWRSVTLLMAMGAGGEILEIIDKDATAPQTLAVTLPSFKVLQLLGEEVPGTQASSILQDLGFKTEAMPTGSGSSWALKVSVPRFRPDIKESADLVEEIARILTLGSFGTRLPDAQFPLEATRYQPSLLRQAREAMRSLGYAECYSYSLLSQKALTRMGFDANVCMKLSNPLADFELLRASLLPGLLLAVENNLTRCDELRLFEAGSVFQRSASTGTDLPHEPAMLGLIVVNCPTAKSSLWKEGESALQAAKTAVSDLLTFLSVPDVSWVQDASQLPASVDQTWLHPGRSVAVLSGQTVIGWLGELHPQKTAFLDLRDRKICYAELDLSLIDQHRTVRQFHRFSSYPSIELDLSFLIAKTAAASEVEQVIREAGGELLTAVKVLDVFEKPEFGEDKKSMTWRMIYQSMERTLLDTEAAAAHENVIRALKTVYSIQVR